MHLEISGWKLLCVGKRDFVVNKFLGCLQSKYEVSTQLLEKPGDEVSFLKRKMVLQHDAGITIQTHHKHVDQMCSLLGLNKRLQNKRTPGHSEMDQLDTSGELSSDQARAFRTCVGILLYLAPDLPHYQHVLRHLATYSTQPTTCSMTVLRHLVSYLACHEDICAGAAGTLGCFINMVLLQSMPWGFSLTVIGQATRRQDAPSHAQQYSLEVVCFFHPVVLKSWFPLAVPKLVYSRDKG
jgi:hypothetical protein